MTTEAERTACLLAALAAWPGGDCAGCGAALCHHALVLNTAMGFKSSPQCAGCLSTGLAQERDTFLGQAHAHVQGRECFRTGWSWASRTESSADPLWPACLFPGGAVAVTPVAAPTVAASDAPAAAAAWNAGDMTCGDLVLELRLRVRELEPGEVLHVTATDSSAPLDLPAWCRVTGHPMVMFEHPDYWIQRKDH